MIKRPKLAQSPALPAVALLLAMLSFTLGASAAKRLFPLVGAEGATTLRLVLGALMLALVARPWRARFSAGSGKPLIAYGFTMGTMNLLFYTAIKSLPLGIAIALEFTGPLTVAVLSSRRLRDLLWITLAVAGLLLLLPFTAETPRLNPWGVAEALGAGACWALYILAGKKAGDALGSRATSLGMSIGALVVLPIGVAHAGSALLLPSTIALGFVVAFLSSALPYTLEMVALRRLPARTYGTLTSSEPAIGALVGLVFMGERLAPLQCGAVGLTIIASLGATMTAVRDRRSGAEDVVMT